MTQAVVAAAFLLVWGSIGIIITVKSGEAPPAEYWTIPAIGLGGLLAAVSSLDHLRSKKQDKSDPDEDTAEETP